MSQERNTLNSVLVIVAIIAGILFFLGLVYRPLMLFLLTFVAFALLFGGIFFIYDTIKRGAKEVNEKEVEVEKNIENQMELCTREITKNRKENNDINNNIRDLESTLDSTALLDTRNRKESKRILAGFYREFELRKAKVEFYEACRMKLDTLLYNYKFSKKLHDKQTRLNELQEEHYEDLAKMEALKSDVAFNLRFLETIESLSLKMLESNSLDSANQLHLELKEITKELRRL